MDVITLLRVKFGEIRGYTCVCAFCFIIFIFSFLKRERKLQSEFRSSSIRLKRDRIFVPPYSCQFELIKLGCSK